MPGCSHPIFFAWDLNSFSFYSYSFFGEKNKNEYRQKRKRGKGNGMHGNILLKEPLKREENVCMLLSFSNVSFYFKMSFGNSGLLNQTTKIRFIYFFNGLKNGQETATLLCGCYLEHRQIISSRLVVW